MDAEHLGEHEHRADTGIHTDAPVVAHQVVLSRSLDGVSRCMLPEVRKPEFAVIEIVVGHGTEYAKEEPLPRRRRFLFHRSESRILLGRGRVHLRDDNRILLDCVRLDSVRGGGNSGRRGSGISRDNA